MFCVEVRYGKINIDSKKQYPIQDEGTDTLAVYIYCGAATQDLTSLYLLTFLNIETFNFLISMTKEHHDTYPL